MVEMVEEIVVEMVEEVETEIIKINVCKNSNKNELKFKSNISFSSLIFYTWIMRMKGDRDGKKIPKNNLFTINF